jgi:hypothetical protein
MTDQPIAMRLANLIDHGNDSSWIEREAAAELRRLHAVNRELLEALREAALALAHATETMPVVYEDDYNRVSAAIAKAEGENS